MFAQGITPFVDREQGLWHLNQDGRFKRLLFYGTVGVRKIEVYSIIVLRSDFVD